MIQILQFAGAPERNRTFGLLLRRQTLYPLSYRGVLLSNKKILSGGALICAIRAGRVGCVVKVTDQCKSHSSSEVMNAH